MEITKDTIFMRSNDFIFYNSKAVFVEYLDIIRSPYFSLLYLLSKSEVPIDIFDTSMISKLSISELLEYYYHGRRSQNPFYDLINFDAENIPDNVYECVDEFTNREITKEIIQYTNPLNFVKVITNLMYTDSLIAKEVIIYYPYDNPAVKRDIAELFNFNLDIKFKSGTLEEALKDVPKDTTYVFSDLQKIETLRELGRLEMSSILLPLEYGYNYTDPSDKGSELLLDIEAYAKETVFKFDMFLASVEMPEVKQEPTEEKSATDEE